MSSAKVNEDLDRERKKCVFNIEELTNFLDGGSESTRRRRETENKILSIKGIRDVVPEEYLSHKERYENAIRKAVLYYRAAKQMEDSTKSVFENFRMNFRNSIMWAVFKDNSPFGLHYAMFLPTIEGQADDKQKEYWLKRANNLEIIGTYAQTELGHGTFIRGLETTATYDAETEEFILHSPTLTAYKWWPGNLGQTVNYCIVIAQLIINGKNYGTQPFMVQVRDEETHAPLPGIKIGEIGPKLGFNTVNNGFLGFDHHRIPRDRMLMKNTQVLKDGTVVASPNSKLAYFTMVFVRVTIVMNSANTMARAATVAIRYSAIRRQSKIRPGEPEPQILDFVSQQHKLLIGIASYYAFSMTAMWLWDIFAKFTSELAAGKLNQLPELHALSCCLKALSSSDCAALVERFRQACGGHGYLLSSNLPQLYGLATAACTYEGENTVMYLQTARSLAKAWRQANEGKDLFDTMGYLADKSSMKQWDGSLGCIVTGFQKVAAGKLATSMQNFDKYRKSGLSYEDAWNKCSVQLIGAAEAHGRAIIMKMFRSEVERTVPALSNQLQTVIRQLVQLYFYYWTIEKLGDLLLYTPITQKDVNDIQRKYEDVLEALRPNAVGLVDAFDFRDEVLHSTLGSYDGRVYERLMEEALKSPLNQEPVNQSFHKYLKPFMQGKL
ncbi:unnamed protein product [Chilo suppressalis]|uniref:Acyl-coenzyme A oxidase n=1 Tax=Chilo suppressalis TaxID=168631 RepID=A0ABN8B7S8_CHISP|nr:unnamed protein product [Chilo suppressalis]